MHYSTYEGNIPSFINVTDGKAHELNVIDFLRLSRMPQAQAFFVIRSKANSKMCRTALRSIDKMTGLRCDQSVFLSGKLASKDCPQILRWVAFYDEKNDKRLTFLTNNFDLPALTITQLYKARWQAALFFKWIKQHLLIKAFLLLQEMPSKLKDGLLYLFMFSWPLPKNIIKLKPLSTLFYRFST